MYGKLYRPQDTWTSEDEESPRASDPSLLDESPVPTSHGDSLPDSRTRRQVFLSDRSLRSGEARSRLHPLLTETDGVRKKPNRKDEAKKASGRLEGNVVIVDDVRDDFESLDPAEAIARHKPPEYPTPSEDEVRAALDWAKNRMATKRKVREDRIYLFLIKYAGYTFRKSERVATAPSRIGRGSFAFSGGGGGGGLAPPVTGPPFTPPRAPQFFAPPGTPGPSSSFPPRTPFSLASAPMDGLPPPPPLFPSSVAPLAPPAPNPEVERALRAVQVAEWVQKPMVIGSWELSDDVFAHSELAFAQLQMRVPHFMEVPDMEAFMESKNNIVHTYFALLAMYASNGNAFFNPTRTPLDRNKKRMRKDVQMLVNALARFRWDSYSRDFRLPKGLGPAPGAVSSSGYPLPSYLQFNPLPRY